MLITVWLYSLLMLFFMLLVDLLKGMSGIQDNDDLLLLACEQRFRQNPQGPQAI